MPNKEEEKKGKKSAGAKQNNISRTSYDVVFGLYFHEWGEKGCTPRIGESGQERTVKGIERERGSICTRKKQYASMRGPT
jgi:hypothetical protein